VHHGIGFANVGQEFVAQTLTLRGASNQAGDIDKLDNGGCMRCGLTIAASLSIRGSGHFNDADVRLNGANG
jgi:hypothetical protein